MTYCLVSRAVTARKFGPPNSYVQLKRNKVSCRSVTEVWNRNGEGDLEHLVQGFWTLSQKGMLATWRTFIVWQMWHTLYWDTVVIYRVHAGEPLIWVTKKSYVLRKFVIMFWVTLIATLGACVLHAPDGCVQKWNSIPELLELAFAHRDTKGRE